MKNLTLVDGWCLNSIARQSSITHDTPVLFAGVARTGTAAGTARRSRRGRAGRECTSAAASMRLALKLERHRWNVGSSSSRPSSKRGMLSTGELARAAPESSTQALTLETEPRRQNATSFAAMQDCDRWQADPTARARLAER
jgi:hypothetical protein